MLQETKNLNSVTIAQETISENLTGKKLKKQSELNLAKYQANKDYKTSEGGVYKMRKNFVEFGQSYLDELNKKYKMSYNMQDILETDVNIFTVFMTDKERKQCENKALAMGKDAKKQPVLTFYLFCNLVGRMIQALYYKEKQKNKATK